MTEKAKWTKFLAMVLAATILFTLALPFAAGAEAVGEEEPVEPIEWKGNKAFCEPKFLLDTMEKVGYTVAVESQRASIFGSHEVYVIEFPEEEMLEDGKVSALYLAKAISEGRPIYRAVSVERRKEIEEQLGDVVFFDEMGMPNHIEDLLFEIIERFGLRTEIKGDRMYSYGKKTSEDFYYTPEEKNGKRYLEITRLFVNVYKALLDVY